MFAARCRTVADPVCHTVRLKVGDVDSANLVSAVVQITTDFNPAQDSLLFTNQLGITGNYNAANGTLTLTGTNTYTGNTLVNSGVLALTDGGLINGTSVGGLSRL